MRQLLPDPAEDLTDDDLVAAYAVPPGEHLRVNFVSSADGAVTLDGASGGLGGPGDRRVFQLLRDLADVILVAAGTVRNEGYGYPRLPPGAPGPPAGRRPAGVADVRGRLPPPGSRPQLQPLHRPAGPYGRGHRAGRPRPTGARSWSGARRCWSSTTCRPRWPSCTGAARSSARAARRLFAALVGDGLRRRALPDPVPDPRRSRPGPDRVRPGAPGGPPRPGRPARGGRRAVHPVRTHPPGRMTRWTCP